MNINNPYYMGPQKNGIIWVQGIEGAKAYPLMPSSNAILMDQESDRFYIKTCDQVGMCNLRSFKYKEEIQASNDYVTREELEEILRGIKDEQSISADAAESETNK